MEFKIGEKIGGITAIVEDNLRDVELVGIGRASVWWNFEQALGICVYPKTDERLKIKKLGEKHRASLPKQNEKLIFGLTEDQKKKLESARKNTHQSFRKALRAGEIPVFIRNMNPHGLPSYVLDVDTAHLITHYPGVSPWDLQYDYLNQLGIWQCHPWMDFEESSSAQKTGKDVRKAMAAKISEIENQEAEAQEKMRKAKAIKEKAREEMKVEILRKGTINGGDGPDYYAHVKITDSKTGESAKLSCRNLFDVGHVINKPGCPGLPCKANEYSGRNGWGWWDHVNDMWTPMSEFEVRAVRYLAEFSPVGTGIRL